MDGRVARPSKGDVQAADDGELRADRDPDVERHGLPPPYLEEDVEGGDGITGHPPALAMPIRAKEGVEPAGGSGTRTKASPEMRTVPLRKDPGMGPSATTESMANLGSSRSCFTGPLPAVTGSKNGRSSSACRSCPA